MNERDDHTRLGRPAGSTPSVICPACQATNPLSGTQRLHCSTCGEVVFDIMADQIAHPRESHRQTAR